MEGTLVGLSPAAPGGESRPRGVPHPPWVDCVFCQSRGSQGGRRGGHLQRGPFRGQRESGSQQRIPGLLGGRGLLRAACPVSASRLGPARSPLQFASFSFCFPSSSSPPSSGNLPPETHHSLTRQAPRPVSKPGRDKGQNQQPRPIPALRGKGGSGASPSLAREGPFPLHSFSGRQGSSAPHKTFTIALYKAMRRLQLQNPPLGICSNCAGFPPGSRN